MPPFIVVAVVALAVVLIEATTASASTDAGSTGTDSTGDSVTTTISNQWFLDQQPANGAEAFAIAISVAEGWLVAGSIPQTRNNPGDLELSGLGVVTTFATLDDGINALVSMMNKIAAGTSLYPLTETIAQMAVTYTGNDQPAAWASNVSAVLTELGYPATPSTPIGQVFAL